LQQLGLKMKISGQLRRAFEARIIAVYEPNLKRYEQEITASINQQYPLNHTRQQLQLLQQELGLSNKIVASIEARVTKAYVQKLQQYERESRAFISSIRSIKTLANSCNCSKA